MTTQKEYISNKMAELQKKKSKDQVPGAADKSAPDVTKTDEVRDREQRTEFYRAFMEKDRAAMAKIDREVAQDYKKKGQNIATPADGGYLVPTTIADSILLKRNALSGFRRLATTLQNLVGPYDLPTEAGKPTAYWVAEGAAITESKSTFGKKTLNLYKIAGLTTFTYESIHDTASNPSLQNLVENQIAFVITAAENDAIVNGDGSTKPFGFRSSDITPASAAATAGGLAYTDVTKVRRLLGTAYRPYGVFVTSSLGGNALENVRDTTGRPIWREGIAEGNPATVLGRPVIELDEIPANLGAGTDTTELWYMDPSFYYLGTGEALRVDWGTRADDFARDQIKLRVIDRIGGRPTFSEAFAKLTGVKSS